MTVNELIEELKKYPEGVRVFMQLPNIPSPTEQIVFGTCDKVEYLSQFEEVRLS